MVNFMTPGKNVAKVSESKVKQIIFRKNSNENQNAEILVVLKIGFILMHVYNILWIKIKYLCFI